MIKPSLEEARHINAHEFQIIPISTEMYADTVTPIEVLKKLLAVSRHCFMLESAEDSKNWGRYTFLGFDPKMLITCLNGVMSITDKETAMFDTNEPNSHIQKILDQYKSVKL
jgi:anthranilate synthase component 1